jgi:Mn-dependent DtxR family transcriptional regulator
MAQASGVPDRLRPIDERILRLLDAEGIQVRLDIERRLSLSNCVTATRCRSLADRDLVRNSNWCCYQITEEGKRCLRADPR